MPDLVLKRYQGQKSGGIEAVQWLASLEEGKDFTWTSGLAWMTFEQLLFEQLQALEL